MRERFSNVHERQVTRRPREAASEWVQGADSSVPVSIVVAILGVMGAAIAVDMISVPGVMVLTVVMIGGLIAALMAWG